MQGVNDGENRDDLDEAVLEEQIRRSKLPILVARAVGFDEKMG